jgi:hypothetical protein
LKVESGKWKVSLLFFVDPASHNLLALEYAVAVVPYMAVVAIWRRLQKKTQSTR